MRVETDPLAPQQILTGTFIFPLASNQLFDPPSSPQGHELSYWSASSSWTLKMTFKPSERNQISLFSFPFFVPTSSAIL